MSAPETGQGPRTELAGADDAGQRIDNYLLRVLRGVPRTRVYRLLRKGEVRVNGGRVKPTYRLQEGDRVRLPPVRTERHPDGRLPPAALERLRDSVLYEDERCLVIDKPPGLAVHAGSGLAAGVIDGMRELRPDLGGLELVHRLDRDTSGCLLLARGRQALRALQQELRDGGFDKTYAAGRSLGGTRNHGRSGPAAGCAVIGAWSARMPPANPPAATSAGLAGPIA